MKNLILLSVFCVLFSCSQTSNNSSTETDTTSTNEAGPIDALDTAGGKGVFFTELKDSQEVASPVNVKMGVVGMEVEVMGAKNPLKGHHHLIIDGAPIEEGQPIMMDDTHLHFGKAQTETELKLDAGFHTVTLQFGNGFHASYGPRWSRTITLKVK